MISDWLDDYIQELAKRFDISYSETIRFLLSFMCSQCVEKVYPEKCAFPLSIEDVVKIIKDRNEGKLDLETNKKLIADVYFETRKLLNFSLGNIKNEQFQNANIKTE